MDGDNFVSTRLGDHLKQECKINVSLSGEKKCGLLLLSNLIRTFARGKTITKLFCHLGLDIRYLVASTHLHYELFNRKFLAMAPTGLHIYIRYLDISHFYKKCRIDCSIVELSEGIEKMLS